MYKKIKFWDKINKEELKLNPVEDKITKRRISQRQENVTIMDRIRITSENSFSP